MSDAPSPLRELFAPEENAARGIHKRFLILKRSRQHLLALPLAPREAVSALRLYSPQRPAARAAAVILRTLLRFGLPTPLRVEECRISPADPFSEFLSGLSPSWATTDGGLGVLFGNPRATGRRFVLMLFENGRAVAVVKAGVGTAAKSLVEAEARFLQSAGNIGITAPLAVLESERVHAFAMLPFPGEAPRHSSHRDIQRVLQPWLVRTASVPLSHLSGWAKVSAACGESPVWKKNCVDASSRNVFPAITHGDFAPWNIKVHPRSGVWQVFDWERGEPLGVPGWDWLHFELQTAILVHREDLPTLHRRIDHLFAAPEFRDYTAQSGIAGLEGALLTAYLLHCVHVHPQTEGMASIKALLQSR